MIDTNTYILIELMGRISISLICLITLITLDYIYTPNIIAFCVIMLLWILLPIKLIKKSD